MVRELKDDGIQTVEREPSLPRDQVVKTNNGTGVVQQTGFNFKTLDGMKGYKEGEKLPEPIIATNRKGTRVLKKPGEPRYYFNENELIQVHRGLGGKKKKLWWVYNKKKPLDVQIRKYLRNMGIPGA